MAEKTFTDKNIVRIRSIDHDNLFDYLSSAYEVLRKIFSYLSLEELEVVSEAIEKWRPIVETTKNERTTIDSFIFLYKWEDCKMWSEASFAITFCLEEDKQLEGKLQKHMRKHAEFLTIESRAGVIGTSSDLTKFVQQQMLTYLNPMTTNTALATHVRIPEFADVGIKTFTWERSISFKKFRESFSIPNNKVIKCLLILIAFQDTDREACRQKDDFVLFLQTVQSESFAVGGCLIDSFVNDENAVTKYVVFYGDHVEAASIVLKQDVNTKQLVYSRVEELKSLCRPTTKGVVFVFRCCSRNKVSRQPKVRNSLIEWEGDALRKHFQRTPIIGCYGYGEFGTKFPSSETPKPESKKVKQCDIWEYSFSTSIVYVGFKK